VEVEGFEPSTIKAWPYLVGRLHRFYTYLKYVWLDLSSQINKATTDNVIGYSYFISRWCIQLSLDTTSYPASGYASFQSLGGFDFVFGENLHSNPVR